MDRESQAIIERHKIQNGRYDIAKVASTMEDKSTQYEVCIFAPDDYRLVRLECMDRDAAEVLYRTILNTNAYHNL